METILAPFDLQLNNDMWKQPSSPTENGGLMRLPSFLCAMTGSTSPTSRIEWSSHLVGMSNALGTHVSPLKEKSRVRLPSIGAMINRDVNRENISLVHRHCMRLYKQPQDAKTTSPRQPELALHSLLTDAAVSRLVNEQPCKSISTLSCASNKAKRISNAKLCGMSECNKRAKAGGLCIAHGGGLRCSKTGCVKHAVSLGLCIGHGGGKRCTAEGCRNASRKNGVCWSHGGKRLCKLEGCNKGPKSGGYCWSHGGKMKK